MVGVGVKVFPLGDGCLGLGFFGRDWLGLRLDIIIGWVGLGLGLAGLRLVRFWVALLDLRKNQTKETWKIK